MVLKFDSKNKDLIYSHRNTSPFFKELDEENIVETFGSIDDSYQNNSNYDDNNENDNDNHDSKTPLGFGGELEGEDKETLYQWSKQFKFSFAECLELKRCHPTIWDGQITKGWLEDIHEPIDEFDIFQKWGGGTYMISAIQLDQEGYRVCVDKKLVRIVGAPKSNINKESEEQKLRHKTRYSWIEDEDLSNDDENNSVRDSNFDFAARTQELREKASIKQVDEFFNQNEDKDQLKRIEAKLNDLVIHSSEHQANIHKLKADLQRSEFEKAKLEQDMANVLKIFELEKQLLLQKQENDMLKRDLILLKDKEKEFLDVIYRNKDMEFRLQDQKNRQLIDVLKNLLSNPI